MGDLVIREARPEDIPGILGTLREALGETPLLRRTPELWSWKHVDNPFGPSLVLVADDNGRIAGVRAMMRWEMRLANGLTLRCLRPVDTATHPDYLRRGIFRDLTMTALEQARTDGVHLVFNTPNEQSAPGYLKMGWTMVARLGALVRPRLGRVGIPFHDSPPSIDQMAPELEPFDNNTSPLADRAPRGLRTPRSQTYLSWRFGAHPTASYGYLREARGGVVVARANARRGRSELVVSDLLGARPGSIRKLARSARAHYIAGWFSPGTPERTVAMKGGMIPVPRRTLRLVALPLVEVGVDVFDLGSWDLATSDLELL